MTNSGPAICTLRDGVVHDITAQVPTLAHLLPCDKPSDVIGTAEGPPLGAIEEIVENSDEAVRDPRAPYLLAPIDIQAVKACGVTFAQSLVERVVEENDRR